MKILVLNGPNLNMLGSREAAHYGSFTLDALRENLAVEFPDVHFTFMQSNIEGELVEWVQQAPSHADAVIINPGGYAHTSVALHDALMLLRIPKVEVHLSHLPLREDFRQVLITARACNGYISGFKYDSYSAAVFLCKKLKGTL